MSDEVVKILALILVWCSMGLNLEIPGPTLIDVRLIFDASYEDVSKSVSGRGVGGFTGALIGGILVDKFGHALDLLVSVSMAGSAMAIMTLPFSPTINTVWFHYFTLGLCGAVMSIAGIRTVLMVWPKKTTVVLHVLHIGYGLGALIVPVFVNPFLAVVEETESPSKNPEKHGGHSLENFKVIKESRVQHAFVALGVFAIMVSMLFCYFHMKNSSTRGYSKLQSDSSASHKNKTENRTCMEAINPATYANGQFKYGLVVMILMVLYFFNMQGGEEMFAHFVRSFSVEVFQFTKTEASYLNTCFWTGLTVCRIVTSITANYVSTGRLFFIQVALHACATVVLKMYAASSRTILWVCTFVEGFLMSPLYPGAIAYVNTLIEVTGVCLMVTQFAGSFGDITYIWFAGRIMDTYGAEAVLYGVEFFGIILFVIVAMFKVVERFKIEHKTEILIA